MSKKLRLSCIIFLQDGKKFNLSFSDPQERSRFKENMGNEIKVISEFEEVYPLKEDISNVED